MRNNQFPILSASDSNSATGAQIDVGQIVAASFHVFFGDSHAAGSLKIQASNDPAPQGGPNSFVVANWVDVPNATASITSGASALLTIGQMAYRWVRAVYTGTANYLSVQTITSVADIAGSLNSTYFLISSINSVSNAEKDFYVWYNDGSGVDPALPGKTGVEITYSSGDSANTIATLTRAALSALSDDFSVSGATDQIVVTNVLPGAVPAAADGTDATGFTFDETNAGVDATTITVNMNVLGL